MVKVYQVKLPVARPLVPDGCRWIHAFAGLGHLQKNQVAGTHEGKVCENYPILVKLYMPPYSLKKVRFTLTDL